ncbi:MAG: DegT/DnrJ/EryC1/StrS family aminotransferase, partial [Bacteroidales bacterium]
PCKIEAAISPETTAIMPVHVYGTPCNVDKIQQIANRHNLKVVYDAAHAFAVKRAGHSILNAGDLSVLSFHATKTYSTIEGGAIVCHTPEMKHHVDNLKNFGFRDETVVEEPGINAKLNEVQAAFGLAGLKLIDQAIAQRQLWARLYGELLSDLDGITFLKEQHDVTYNYSYFPIFINSEAYGMNRDQLYQKLKDHGIFGRRYFYPLISNFNPYRQLPSAATENLPVANQMADSVICLPLHHQLCDQDVKRIVGVIKNNAL